MVVLVGIIHLVGHRDACVTTHHFAGSGCGLTKVVHATYYQLDQEKRPQWPNDTKFRFF